MARTWLSVTVELLGGRGEQLWPWPGRIFAVGPSHTFTDLATVINDGFARWDRAHLSMFTLADGTLITDAATGAEMTGSIGGPLTTAINIDRVKVARILKPGEEFQFTFDLGDDWTHRCVVGEDKIDPLQVLGVRPDVPLAYWGWGGIPDQYGRRWAEDDGETSPPSRPDRPHPMLTYAWPDPGQAPGSELSEVRAATAQSDADRFLAAVMGRQIDDALQQVAAGIPMVLQQNGPQAEAVAVAVINRLNWRDSSGDAVLAEDLLATFRGEPLSGRVVPVDLDMLGSVREHDHPGSTGGYVDLRTGQVFDDTATDPNMVGEDASVDVDNDPDRWLRFEFTGPPDGWADMAAFAATQRDHNLRDHLEQAIRGAGALGRFKDLIADENLTGQWHTFCDDRRLGRARRFLADQGIRVG